ncbi:MAG: Gx transporter family protein [Thermodesulfobacteriota bacterium]
MTDPVRRLARLAVLLAMATVIHTAEALLPVTVLWFRFGFANIIGLATLCLFGFKDALVLTVGRIVLGSLATGQFGSPAFMLAFAGGISGIGAMGLARSLSERLGARIGSRFGTCRSVSDSVAGTPVGPRTGNTENPGTKADACPRSGADGYHSSSQAEQKPNPVRADEREGMCTTILQFLRPLRRFVVQICFGRGVCGGSFLGKACGFHVRRTNQPRHGTARGPTKVDAIIDCGSHPLCVSNVGEAACRNEAPASADNESSSGSTGLFSEVGISIIGAIFHNLGQLAAAYLVLVRSEGILLLLPFMWMAAVGTGFVNGLAARFVVERLRAASQG